MKIAPKFHRLEKATDRDVMMGLFTKYLDRIAPGSEELVDLKIPRLFPQADDSFVVQYDLSLRRADSAKIENLLVGGILPGSADSLPGTIMSGEMTVRCDDIPLLLVVFPHDPALLGLRQLTGELRLPEAVEISIRKYLKSDFSLSADGIKPLGWRPGRRAVVRISVTCDAQAGGRPYKKEFVVKIVRSRKAAKLFKRISKLPEILAAGDSDYQFQIPRIHAADPESGMLIMSVIEGSNLYRLIGDDSFEAGSYQAGELLRQLHRLEGISLPEHNWGNELKNTLAMVERTNRIFPDAFDLTACPIEQLPGEDDMAINSSEQKTIHRDYYDKQIIPGEAGPALLDLDNLSTGDPAQDVGNFIAHLKLRGRQYPARIDRTKNAEIAFRSGYGPGTEDFNQRVEHWQRLTLIRLTCLYLLRPKWRGLAQELMRAGQGKIEKDLQPRGKV